MNEREAYDVIMKHLCKEVVQIAEQIQKNSAMSVQDLEKVDKIYHAKKSMLTAKAMEEAEEYENYEGGMSGTRMTYSGRRGRDAMTGRYISRDSGGSYSEGYDRGYSEAMSRMPYYPNRY